MENMDSELFEVRLESGKSIHVCRFCERQFPYGLRKMHRHSAQCEKFLQHQQEQRQQGKQLPHEEAEEAEVEEAEEVEEEAKEAADEEVAAPPPARARRRPAKSTKKKQPRAKPAKRQRVPPPPPPAVAVATMTTKPSKSSKARTQKKLAPRRELVEPLDEAFAFEHKEAVCRYCHRHFDRSVKKLKQHLVECKQRLKMAGMTGATPAMSTRAMTTTATTTTTTKKKKRQREQDDDEEEEEEEIHEPVTRIPRKRLRHDAKRANDSWSPLRSSTKVEQWVFNPSDHFDLFVRHGLPAMRCKYCAMELQRRKGMGEHHLAKCDALVQRRSNQSQSRSLKLQPRHELRAPPVKRQLASHSDDEEEADDVFDEMELARQEEEDEEEEEEEEEAANERDEMESSSHHENDRVVLHELVKPVKLDEHILQRWLFGDVEGAQAIKSKYFNDAYLLNRPKERWDPVIRDYLFGLQLHQLVTHAVSLKSADPNYTFQLVLDSHRHVTQSTELHTASEARMLYDAGFSICMDVPRRLRNVLVPFLAKDLGVDGYFVRDQDHETPLVFAQTGCLINWQYHQQHSFVFCLRGNVVWRLQARDVADPISCCHPHGASVEDLESMAKVQEVVGAFTSKLGFRSTEDMDHVEEVTMYAGSVLYLPSGTWHQVEAKEDAVWMEMRIASTAWLDVVLDGLRQVLARDWQWRRAVVRGDLKNARLHGDALLTDLLAKVDELTSTDLIPECIMDAADQHVVERGGGGASPPCYEFDIRDYDVPADHQLKLFPSTHFRVNPLAVLKSQSDVAALDSTRARDKPKAWRYLLNVNFGNQSWRSKLRVQFHSDDIQKEIVECIRTSHGQVFKLMEVMDAMQPDGEPEQIVEAEDDENVEHAVGKRSRSMENAVRYVIRFLCWVGYLSAVKVVPSLIKGSPFLRAQSERMGCALAESPTDPQAGIAVVNSTQQQGHAAAAAAAAETTTVSDQPVGSSAEGGRGDSPVEGDAEPNAGAVGGSDNADQGAAGDETGDMGAEPQASPMHEAEENPPSANTSTAANLEFIGPLPRASSEGDAMRAAILGDEDATREEEQAETQVYGAH